MRRQREGFTTGSCATAAALARYLQIHTSEVPQQVEIELPDGSRLTIPITMKDGKVGCIKDAGDDPDVTNGIFIYADVELGYSSIIIDGGLGVGRVTRKGLSIHPGEAAINPVPRQMIAHNLNAAGCNGAKVNIYAENGEEIAARTFNPKLGIVGGISILGRSGIVRPMSHDAIVETIYCEIDVRQAEDAPFIWLVPGKIGEDALLKSIPEAQIVQMSNFAGEALAYVRKKGYSKVGVAGHPGKLAKLAMGEYNTHSAASPQANDYVATVLGVSIVVNSVEELCTPEHYEGFNKIATLIAARIEADFHFEKVAVRLFAMDSREVGSYA